MHLLDRDFAMASPDHVTTTWTAVEVGRFPMPPSPELIDTDSLSSSSSSSSSESLSSCATANRLVHFDDRSNRVHTYERVAVEARANVWYQPSDYEGFRRERFLIWSNTVKQTDNAADEKESSRNAHADWARAMIQRYYTFRQCDDPLARKEALAQLPSLCMDASTLGLEMALLAPIRQDYIVRRNHLMHQMRVLQGCIYDTDHDRDVMLRETSRLSSQAAVMFAHHVATTSAAAL